MSIPTYTYTKNQISAQVKRKGIIKEEYYAYIRYD